jgi:hypothetical protein
MKLEQLLKTTPETLAMEQYAALKEHTIKTLNTVIKAIENDADYPVIQEMTAYSPAGDGMGCDNSFINFGFSEKEPLDIMEVVGRLEELRTISKKKKK